MGRLGAMGMAEAVNDGSVSLDGALHWHLSANHYPPVPEFMVPVARRAIVKANRGDERGRVRLPVDVTCRKHGQLCPVWHIVDQLNLDSFIEGDYDD